MAQSSSIPPTNADDDSAGSDARVDRPPEAAAPGGTPSPPEASVTPGSTGSAAPIDQAKTVISSRPIEGQSAAPATASPLEMGMALQGQTLDHFELREFVGGGGMGAVFRALDTQLDRIVAVKVLSRDQTDEESLRRFKNEAQSAARLDHPNIARVYYVGQDRGWNYIVFEFIEGINIRDLVEQKGPLSLDESVGYCLQMGEALEHAFRRDVVHRDIKPSNVLVLPDGRAKLVDMGLARLHQVESPSGDLTASGVTLGTFDYISPEQALDPRNADVRSDLYSLGCTFYFMLTARPPFPEGTVLQKLLRHSSDEPPDPRLYRPDLPEEILVILNKLLAKQPKMRYQEPSELIGELLVAADRLGLRTAGRGGTVWIAPAPARFWTLERHLPAVASVVAFAALVATVFAVDWALARRETQVGVIPRPVLPRESAAQEPTIAPPTPPIPSPGGDSPGAIEHSATGANATAANSSNSGQPTQGTAPSTVADAGTGQPASLGGPDRNTTPTALAVGASTGDAPAGAGIGPETLEGTASADASAAQAGPAMVRLAAADLTGWLDLPLEDADSAADGSAISAVPATPRVVVVGPAETKVAADEALVDSLAAAISRVNETPGIRNIELRTSGPLYESPLELASDSLTIRAAQGYSPLIVFSPGSDDIAAHREMMRVAGGNLRLEGVHLWMRLPREAADGWSLFQLDQTQSVSLQSCSLTIENVDAFGGSRQDRVAFFDVQGPRPQMGGGPTPSTSIPPAIVMSQTVVRGRATLVYAAQACAFSLNWSQGLFVSSEWMIETGGAATRPQEGLIELDLQHVTAQMGEGLCSIQGRASAPYYLYLDVECGNCIFVTGASAPLIEHVGLARDADGKEPFKLKGEGNFYPGTSIVWRAVPRDSSLPALEYGPDDDKWTPGQFVRRQLMWDHTPAPDRALHLRTRSDYLLLDHPSNPALRSADGHGRAGFDAALLPDAPQSAEPAAKSASGAPATNGQRASPTTGERAVPSGSDRAAPTSGERQAPASGERTSPATRTSDAPSTALPVLRPDAPSAAAPSAVEVRMEIEPATDPDDGADAAGP